MKSITVSIKTVKTNPNNPRLVKDDKFKKLVNSIKTFPEMLKIRPIVVNNDMVVLGGNMRLKACKEAGLKEVHIIKADTLTEEQQREFIIKDNVGFGEWDWDLIANEWNAEEVTEWGLDLPLFEDDEVLEAEEDDYDIPDDLKIDVVLGDLIEIGEHRLLCGDSTDSDQVAKLMDGNKAYMVFTDPPYDLEDLSYTDNLFLFTNGHIFILNSEQRNVDISSKHREYLKRWYAIDFRQAHLVSNQVPMTRVDFVAEFRNSENVKFNNLKKGFTTLIECCKIHSNKGETIHKQEKKIELPFVFIEHHSNEKNIILDLFLGSGSTMVAAHQLKRKCYGMELDPKYCQVIIDRMTKLDDTLTVKINGKEYKKQTDGIQN